MKKKLLTIFISIALVFCFPKITLAASPVFKTIEIFNSSWIVVPPETGNRNHICQVDFINRDVTIIIESDDADGIVDITSMQIRFAGQVYNPESLVNGTGVFVINFPQNQSESLTDIEVEIIDAGSNTSGWVDTGRDFKVWNCEVGVTGSIFDGSNAVFGSINCNDDSNDFLNKINSSINYGLNFKTTFPQVDKTMTVISPDFQSSSNKLIWDAEYFPEFTNMPGSNTSMKVPNKSTCQSSIIIDDTVVNPYLISPTITINFSTMIDQVQWFQVEGGGIMAKSSITNIIPNTCNGTCKPYISRNSLFSTSGIVSATTLNKDGGDFSEGSNWNMSKNTVGEIKGYKYFYNEFHVKANKGVYIKNNTDMTNIMNLSGGTGVVFVNGKVDIDTNNTVSVGKFFMIVASDDINIVDTTTRIDGFLITDKNINIIGLSNTQLEIQGSLYSNNDIKITRGFIDVTLNAKNPSVLITYRPDMLFSIPGSLTKVISSWREGI